MDQIASVEKMCLDNDTENDFVLMAKIFSSNFNAVEFMSALGAMANVAANLNECSFRDPVVDFMDFCGSPQIESNYDDDEDQVDLDKSSSEIESEIEKKLINEQDSSSATQQPNQ